MPKLLNPQTLRKWKTLTTTVRKKEALQSENWKAKTLIQTPEVVAAGVPVSMGSLCVIITPYSVL